MPKKLMVAFMVLALVTLACSLTPSTPSTNPTSAPVQQATATQPPIQPTAPTSSVLFHDDFSDPSSGWGTNSDSNGSVNYASGGFEIHITTTSLFMWANPGKGFQNDVRLEVDATKVGGPDDNAFGVICRYQDSDNFYKFYITSDGYAGIIKEAKSSPTVISSPDGKLQPVKGINQGNLTNHIRADCVGSTLTLYANGTQVAKATDSTFSGGDVGLVAATYSTVGTDIVFKKFYVYAP
jgi:pectate lyase